MRVFNKQIATATVLNANRTTTFVELKSIVLYCITAVITGTPTGTIRLQACNDPDTNNTIPVPNSTANPTHWVDITDSSFVVTTAGTTMWNVREPGYNYVRVAYTDASSGASTATMTATFNGKGV